MPEKGLSEFQTQIYRGLQILKIGRSGEMALECSTMRVNASVMLDRYRP